MLLSIIIPTFNSERTIYSAIYSVITQTFSNWELLIIDGASTDSTVEIVESFRDKRIMVLSEPDQGIYDAMNKGIERARGDWVYFLGSDDYLISEGVLTDVLSYSNNADILYGDVESVHLCKRHFGEWGIKDIDFNRCHQAIFYKKCLFYRFGKYDTRYVINADYAFNLKVFFNRKIKAKYLPLTVAHFSKGGASSQIIDSAFDQDFDSIILKNLYWKLFRSQKIYYLSRYIENETCFLNQLFPKFIIALLRFEGKCKTLITRSSSI